MKRKYAQFILEKNQKDYDRMANIFFEKRQILTNDIKILDKYAKSGDKILDWGCGFGRLYEIFIGKKVKYFGVDVSERQIQIAKSIYPKNLYKQVPYLSLPFSDNFFNIIYCLSVFHHIPSNEFRIQFLKEAKRVLKPKDLLILTVWKIPKDVEKKTDPKIDPGDIFIPFKNSQGKTLANRYFHKFNYKELKKLFNKVGFKTIKTETLKRGKYENLLIIGKK